MILKHIIGQAIGRKFCLPAQHKIKKETIERDKLDKTVNFTSKTDDNCYKTDRTVNSSNNAEIFLSEFVPTNLDNSKELSEKIIIHAFGNSDSLMRHTNQLADDAIKYNCRVIGFDFRNVAKSTGVLKCDQDLVDDALSVINYYRKQHNIPLDNIILSGESMGAAILTMSAAQLYEQEKEKQKLNYKDSDNKKTPCVSLMNVRSFNDFADIGVELLSNGKLPRVIKYISKVIFTIILKLSFGMIDAAKAYNSLPNDKKDYIFAVNDPIICDASSLHYSVRAPYKSEKSLLKKIINSGTYDIESIKQAEQKLRFIRERKLQISPVAQEKINQQYSNRPLSDSETLQESNKKPEAKPPNVHNLPLRDLISASKRFRSQPDRSHGNERYQRSIHKFLNR